MGELLGTSNNLPKIGRGAEVLQGRVPQSRRHERRADGPVDF
ncbi:MAG: hypothetical protein AVDCRST_MAG86-1016 [uncultured Truepera sp.]|uniref:Uncharacterized protein n=1 Tax=uncultured Truepera sp. TaxID=543023 RepID=A0A6J4V5T4_9DEIN|nr:MAG: hypothetical protein AVDCRST_MAG86-1016 [uncultured Truepera sp.]